jgi:cytochrome c oxidase assembly protein subunit 15
MDIDSRTRRLAGASAGLTFVLVLLGVYTAADGAGLTCAGRWPLCDGAVFGLFPANVPSFVEWFHRLWAMVTGLVVVAATVSAFRSGAPRRLRYALGVATLVLPTQIALGALTVTRYELLVLLAHFFTAFTIFTLLVTAAAWAYADRLRGLRRRALAAAVVLAPLYLFLSPRLVLVYSEWVQAGFYAVGMAAYAVAVGTALYGSGRVRTLGAGAAAVLFVELVVGRQVYGATGELLMAAGALVAFAALGVAYALSGRESVTYPSGGVTGDD